MAYTLEDEFGDIIGKARRGNDLSVSEVAASAGTHRITTLPDGRLYAETDRRPSPQNRRMPQSQRRTVNRYCDGTLGTRTRPTQATMPHWRSSPSQQTSVDGPSMRTYWYAKRPTRLPSSTQPRTQTMYCKRWKKPASSRPQSC